MVFLRGLRLDYCGLGHFHGVPVCPLYKFLSSIYSLLSYTTNWTYILYLYHDMSVIIMVNDILVKMNGEVFP